MCQFNTHCIGFNIFFNININNIINIIIIINNNNFFFFFQ